MMRVGIRELKVHLSQYVRAAQAGEHVVVTDRGREVAQLTALNREEPGLQELIAEGLLEWSGNTPDLGDLHPLRIKGGPISTTVLDQRGPK
jgi:prevent-host-death family protein